MRVNFFVSYLNKSVAYRKGKDLIFERNSHNSCFFKKKWEDWKEINLTEKVESLLLPQLKLDPSQYQLLQIDKTILPLFVYPFLEEEVYSFQKELYLFKNENKERLNLVLIEEESPHFKVIRNIIGSVSSYYNCISVVLKDDEECWEREEKLLSLKDEMDKGKLYLIITNSYWTYPFFKNSPILLLEFLDNNSSSADLKKRKEKLLSLKNCARLIFFEQDIFLKWKNNQYQILDLIPQNIMWLNWLLLFFQTQRFALLRELVFFQGGLIQRLIPRLSQKSN